MPDFGPKFRRPLFVERRWFRRQPREDQIENGSACSIGHNLLLDPGGTQVCGVGLLFNHLDPLCSATT